MNEELKRRRDEQIRDQGKRFREVFASGAGKRVLKELEEMVQFGYTAFCANDREEAFALGKQFVVQEIHNIMEQ